MALAAYRNLLRSTRIAFQGESLIFLPTADFPRVCNSCLTTLGDLPLLTAARKQARTAFSQNATLPPTDPASIAAVAHAEEVAKILRENVVQGKKESEEERYSKYFDFLCSVSLSVSCVYLTGLIKTL